MVLAWAAPTRNHASNSINDEQKRRAFVFSFEGEITSPELIQRVVRKSVCRLRIDDEGQFFVLIGKD